MSDTMNLEDVPAIPDLSGLSDETQFEEWQNAWYEASILEQRSFTDKNGNDRVFASGDEPSTAGDSRNIRLQMLVKRASDGRTMNIGSLTNYRPDDLTQETVQQAIADSGKPRDEQNPSLLRAKLTLQRLAKLQKVAGIRQFQKNGNGGLDLHSLFGKSCFVRLKEDDRNPQFKQVADIRVDRPTKAKVL